MNVVRLISWFSKDDESLKGEFFVDFIDFEVLISIFKPNNFDPLLYYPYVIDKDVAKVLNQYNNFDFDFDKYIYQLDCFQANSGQRDQPVSDGRLKE